MKRYLTKSRFKLGLECPTKLYYTGKNDYANQKKDDEFLEALAQGGFQVEELARLEYEGGTLVEGNNWDYDLLVKKTNELLNQENVILYEPAFYFDNCFVRVDIIVKKGSLIQLIEVKSKSISLNDEFTLVGKRGGLRSQWKPYLYDVAFQEYVMQNSYPNWDIRPYLLLVNKDKKASVDLLNQKFKISSKTNKRTGVIVEKGLTKKGIGNSILAKISIQTIISDIKSGKYKNNYSLSFFEEIVLYSNSYTNDLKINTQIGVKCKKCEFHNILDKNKKSGFIECWKNQLNLSEKVIERPKVYDVWNFKSAFKLMNESKNFIEDITEDDLVIKPNKIGLSLTERQWLQVSKEQQSDNTPYIDLVGLKEEMDKWKFPLNFIDFETSTVAIPFNKGRKPYEQIAFQFSHHILFENGKIIHQTEYINTKAGEFPNFNFIRNLKNALSINSGSIFKYSNHENTILNAIFEQLDSSNEVDKLELMYFIKTISHSKNNSLITWYGERDMIDLLEIVKLYYYDPLTKGSNSIKAVLPAVLNRSRYLKTKYVKPIKEINIRSKNFDINKSFIVLNEDQVLNPYNNLPKLFENWNEEELDNLISELEEIDNGGTALIAYSRLQFQEMKDAERQEIKKALLMYCELDTLAMVMIYEFFRESINS